MVVMVVLVMAVVVLIVVVMAIVVMVVVHSSCTGRRMLHHKHMHTDITRLVWLRVRTHTQSYDEVVYEDPQGGP